MANVSVLNTTAQLSGKTIAVCENDQTVSGAWTFSGNQTFNGNVTIGNAVGDTLTVNSTITSNLIFTDATYDIGASGATRPRDLFLSRNATIGGTLAVTGATTVTGDFTANGNVTLGNATTDVLNGFLITHPPGGRLTLTTAVPVTTSNVTGATTIYYTPYVGSLISLYDGTDWVMYVFAELSLALGTLTATLPYDVFIYDNSGTLTLELTAWTNGTTRATALVRQNGILCKTGALTRRYLGTIYTTSTTATEDSETKRFVWNYYNQRPRPLKRFESTDTWTYDTDTMRQAGGSASNQVEMVIGVNEVPARATLTAGARHSSSGSVSVGIGLDSTTASSGTTPRLLLSTAAGYLTAQYAGFPGIGYHYLAWLERGGGATTTFIGDESGADYNQSGLLGTIRG